MHQLSCPYTSQQNAVAERKHRHIVDTGLALLAHSHLPLTYGVEAFNTSTYLINRLPTPILKQNNPYTKLFNVAPDYTFLRVFGCACYPLLRPYNSHKLEFRSKKCVFLGYSSNHHGYRCLDLDSNKVYTSRHVVFDELSFPFRDKAMSTRMSKETASFIVPLPSPAIPSYQTNTPLDPTPHDHYSPLQIGRAHV